MASQYNQTFEVPNSDSVTFDNPFQELNEITEALRTMARVREESITEMMQKMAEKRQQKIDEAIRPLVEASQFRTQLAAKELSNALQPMRGMQLGMQNLEALSEVLASDLISIDTGFQPYPRSVARSTPTGVGGSHSYSAETVVTDYTWGLSDEIESKTLLAVYLWDTAIEEWGLEPAVEHLKDREVLQRFVFAIITYLAIDRILSLI